MSVSNGTQISCQKQLLKSLKHAPTVIQKGHIDVQYSLACPCTIIIKPTQCRFPQLRAKALP